MRSSSVSMRHNILSVYRVATREDIATGTDWYPRAHSLVVDWAETYNRSIANVACIVAALSPQIGWSRNLIVAGDILAGNPPSIGGCILRFVRIAERVRDDRAWELRPYFKQGCKVQCFAGNLAGNFDIVTVDTHAAQVAAGSPLANLRVDTWRDYEPVASAFADAARHIGIQPATLQAITWACWKRLYPQGRKNALRRRW